MRNRLMMVLAIALGLMVSIPLSAHHGAATLYGNQTVTLKGTVKTWFWSNPHCLLTFDVKGDDGKVVEWVVETQAPSTVYVQGFRKDTFKPGDQVTIIAQPAKNERPNGRLMSAILADGTKLGTTLEGSRGAKEGEAAPY